MLINKDTIHFMGELIKSYGAFVLAFIGFIQFWIKILWDKYFRKGEIDYHETGTIEIGYGNFGPTIGLNGTLRALNKDVFVKSIDLVVIREKDKSQHIFTWLAFRPPKIDLGGSQPMLLEIPSGFLISINSPYKFNIVFNDNKLFEEIRPQFNDYLVEWYKIVEQLNKIIVPSGNSALQANYLIPKQTAIIQDFRKSKVHLDIYTDLDRKYYWEPCDYSLTINIRTSRPDRIFRYNYHFLINEADSKNLRLNTITILEEPVSRYLRVQNYPYYFAYSSYKKGERINE